MARPNEVGLDYFPIDVNLFENEKIKLIESEFGVKGSYIFLRLLCLIYQKNGYYYFWNDDKKLLLSKSSGVEGNLVGEIISGFFRRSLFDKRVFESFGILTSAQIQKNYLEAVKRREKVPFDINVALIDVSAYINLVSVNIMQTETPISDNISTQSKVEYSKEKKSINSSPQKNEFSEEAKEYALYFKTLIPENQNITESNIKSWAITFDDLIRLDGRTKEEIYAVTKWAREDSFWKENFFSARKLRNKDRSGVKYYDIFLTKYNSERNRNGTGTRRAKLPSWLQTT